MGSSPPPEAASRRLDRPATSPARIGAEAAAGGVDAQRTAAPVSARGARQQQLPERRPSCGFEVVEVVVQAQRARLRAQRVPRADPAQRRRVRTAREQLVAERAHRADRGRGARHRRASSAKPPGRRARAAARRPRLRRSGRAHDHADDGWSVLTCATGCTSQDRREHASTSSVDITHDADARTAAQPAGDVDRRASASAGSAAPAAGPRAPPSAGVPCGAAAAARGATAAMPAGEAALTCSRSSSCRRRAAGTRASAIARVFSSACPTGSP